MDIARFDVVDAVNTYLHYLRSDVGVAARVSVVMFNSHEIDTVRDRVPLQRCDDLRLEEYQPRGGTPLLDAVSTSVGLADCLSQVRERRILAVLTDGLENASRGTTRAELKLLLQRKQMEGWLLLYLGAGHDSVGQASQIGIEPCHTADFSIGVIGETAQVLHAVGQRFLAGFSRGHARRAGALTNDERQRLTAGSVAAQGRSMSRWAHCR